MSKRLREYRRETEDQNGRDEAATADEARHSGAAQDEAEDREGEGNGAADGDQRLAHQAVHGGVQPGEQDL